MNAQALHFSRDLSAMQSTVVTLLRHLDPLADESDRVLYARWYCKRAISQQIASKTEAPSMPAAPLGAAGMAAVESSWADQVASYLSRKRNERSVQGGGVYSSGDRQG